MLNSKKGIVPALIIPIVLGVLMLIAAISFLSSVKMRFILIGAGIIVLTFVYVLPAALQGNLTSRKLGLVLAIFFVGIVVILIGSFNLIPQTTFGAQTLSLSKAELNSNFAPLNGPVWLLQFTQGPLSQSYTGVFTPSTVDAATADASRPTKNMAINIDFAPTKCNYPITRSSENIKDLQMTKWTCIIPGAPSISAAQAKTGWNTILYTGYDTFACWAIGYTSSYPVGNLPSQPALENEFTVSLAVDGVVNSQVFNTLSGPSQGTIGTLGYLSYNGNLLSPNSCETANQFAISSYRSVYKDGSWKLIDAGTYSTYKAKYDSFYLSSGSFFANNGYNSIYARVQDIKVSASNALVFKSVADGNVLNANSEFSGAKLQIVTNTPVAMPVNTLYIKADKLGIYTPSPSLAITSTTSSCFKTGESGTVAVSVRNSGNVAGSGMLNLQCNNPFYGNSVQTGNIPAGATQSFKIPISASASSRTQSACTVSLTGAFETKSSTVNVCVDPQPTCFTPYPTKFCVIESGKQVLKQCTADQSTATTIQVCASDETCDGATQSCRKTGLLDVNPIPTAGEDSTLGTDPLADEKKACEDIKGGLLGYRWVTQVNQPSFFTEVITLGTAKETVTGYCKATYVPYYVLGSVVIIFSVIIILLLRSPKGSRRGRR